MSSSAAPGSVCSSCSLDTNGDPVKHNDRCIEQRTLKRSSGDIILLTVVAKNDKTYFVCQCEDTLTGSCAKAFQSKNLLAQHLGERKWVGDHEVGQ